MALAETLKQVVEVTHCLPIQIFGSNLTKFLKFVIVLESVENHRSLKHRNSHPLNEKLELWVAAERSASPLSC